MRYRLMPVVCLAVCSFAAAQQSQPEEIRIVAPVVDKGAGRVTLPGAFWNSKSAEWVEVGLCGRPSDFLHETVICSTTTRTLLEGALRDIGCHDGDEWVDGVKDFPRVRGDRLMVLLEFTRDGKPQVYSLDELLEFRGWGVSLGPYGFLFRGDPGRSTQAPASAPAGEVAVSDSMKILRDDPQVALVFKGLQSMTQTFADHPLAYADDAWLWGEIDRARNTSALPADVYDSNGGVPVKITFQKVSEEQLITESAKVWHDEASRAYMLKQLDLARQIDREKVDYWALRHVPAARAAESRPRLALLAAQLQRDYAALDAAWSAWASDHVKPEGASAEARAQFAGQAGHWKSYMALVAESAKQLALAEQYAFARQGATQPDAAGEALAAQELIARSRALEAQNTQAREYWREEKARIKDPAEQEVWAKHVASRLAVAETRLAAAAAGAAYGNDMLAAFQNKTAAPAQSKVRYTRAALQMLDAETRDALANVEFEISKSQGLGIEDPDLPGLQKQRESLTKKLADLKAQLDQLPAE